MKIILIDDEPLILEELSYLCEKHKDIEICGKFVNPKQALQYVAGHPVDFAFCDIRMPGITGLELLDQMHKEKPDLQVAFVTAYDQYAFDAYQLDACDYLLKPFGQEEVDCALDKAVRHIQGQEEARETKEAEEQGMPVIRLSSVKNTKNKYVEQAVQQIREHYQEDINISTVAGELEISEGYLSRVFKKETDYTFTSYLTLYRMKKAMTLLKDCRVKVYEVAEQVGYSDTAYFSAQFKKVTGISPSEYQDRSR